MWRILITLLLVSLQALDKDSTFETLSYLVDQNDDQLLAILSREPHLLKAADKRGWNALHHAASKGRTSAIALLIDKGCNIEALDNDHYSPLHIALNFRESKAQSTLLGYGATVDIHTAVALGRTMLVSTMLRDNPAAVAIKRGGCTPLHWAAYHSQLECAELLLVAGADVSTKCDTSQRTALHLAAESASPDLVDLLLSRGSDPNALDLESNTPLHLAAFSSRTGSVRHLLKVGAKVNARNSGGYTALIYAAGREASEIVDLLLRNGVDQYSKDEGLREISRCSLEGVGVAKMILDNGASARAPTGIWSSLHWAAYNGNFALVGLLCSRGADANVLDEHGLTPLHIAATEGHMAVARSLLDRGADTKITSREGLTSQDCARKSGHLELARLLDPSRLR